MSPGPGFAVGWDAGPSSQIEVFSPNPRANSGYQLKFTPPFRSTLRPPQRPLQLIPATLERFRKNMADLFIAANARSEATAEAPTSDEVIKKTRSYGGQLFRSIVPFDSVLTGLNAKDLYLEIGVDEPLIEFPWELLHDGAEFLCLKHKFARFVNVTQESIPPGSPPDPWTEGPLKVLIISVPKPQQRDGQEFKFLSSAQKETDAIVEIIDSLGDAAKKTTLAGPNATIDSVFDAIERDRYHIVHFNGHAYFDNSNPSNSSLVLFDGDIDSGTILAYFARKPPVLSFMNGCETAMTPPGVDRYNIFNLARALLDTGSYLIGNRWKVGDEAAAAFAKSFYQKLLVDGQPLGQVIRDARKDCKEKMPNYDFSWASYIFYGDPRLCFRKLT
jgi:CHAT domain-containing protein